MPTIKYKENGQWKYITTGGGDNSSADSNVYVQNDEPADAPIGTIWVDMDEYIDPSGEPIALDQTLSVENMAADSKAVGDALSNKQDTITGTPGQFVVIGDDGKLTTKTFSIAEEVTF